MTEDPPMIRHWNLVRMLSARRLGVTVQEMARELGVTDKTIRRDLKFLRRMGVPMEERTGDYGRKTWWLGKAWSGAPLQLKWDEAAALYLGRQLLESMAGTPFWSAANRAWRQIRSTLGEVAAGYIDQFSRVFYCTEASHRDYSSKAVILDSLTIAIEDHRATHITYRSDRATEPATRDVYPLTLIRHHTGALYLAAFAPEREEVRHYKVDRIEDAVVSPVVFQIHRDFDVAAHLSGSLGIYDGDEDITVVIKFLPAAARHAQESTWHKSKVFTPQRDGSLVLRLQLSSTVEIKSRVLAYGASAAVLEPEELRVEIAAELEQMLHAYREPAVNAQGDRAPKSSDPQPGVRREDIGRGKASRIGGRPPALKSEP
jgi:predicted DNA-binding transcriptional regulator YafY